MMIWVALLCIVAFALAIAAFRWERRGGRAQEVNVDSVQVERDVYEHLYGDSSGRGVERSPDGQSEKRRGQRTRPDRTDPRTGRAPGTKVIRRAVRGSMQQT